MKTTDSPAGGLFKTRQKTESTSGSERTAKYVRCGNPKCSGRTKSGKRPVSVVSYPERVPTDDETATELAKRGWKIGNDWTKHRCPACVAHATGKKPENVPAPPKQFLDIGAPLRKRILAALLDSYDIGKQQYVGGCSDQTVAKEIGVPWGYVKLARDHNDLPDDHNELKQVRHDIETAKQTLHAWKKKVEEAHALLFEEFDRLEKAIQRIIVT